MEGKSPATAPYAEPPPPYPGTGSQGGYPEPKPYMPVGGGVPQGPYPPPGSYPAYGYSQPQQIPVTGITQVIVTSPSLGPHPVGMQCPRCAAQIVTETQPVAGTLTWLLCILITLVGCFWGCCLIPFCVDECQDIEHRCANCKAHLGTYHRM